MVVVTGARPLSWNDLSLTNQRALTAILAQLSHICAHPAPAPASPPPPYDHTSLDFFRARNVFLIDGDRGVGKTSALLSLLDALRPRPEAMRVDGVGEDAREALNTVRRVALAVGPIELSTQSDGSNLFALIGSHLRALVAHGTRRSPSAHAEPARWGQSWSRADPGSGDDTWQSLIKALAAGWDGPRLQPTAGSDVEAYARRIEEASRSKMDLRALWQRLVDEAIESVRLAPLTSSTSPLHPPDPGLIVIGIDDADLSPHHHQDLLRILHLLQHPRLAFVLTGDERQFVRSARAMFRQRSDVASIVVGDVVVHTGGQFTLQSGASTSPDDERATERLAAEYVEKIIPSAHRHHLSPPSPDEAYETTRPLLQSIPLPRALPRIEASDAGARVVFAQATLGDLFRLDPMCRQLLPRSRRRLESFRLQVQAVAQGVEQAGERSALRQVLGQELVPLFADLLIERGRAEEGMASWLSAFIEWREAGAMHRPELWRGFTLTPRWGDASFVYAGAIGRSFPRTRKLKSTHFQRPEPGFEQSTSARAALESFLHILFGMEPGPDDQRPNLLDGVAHSSIYSLSPGTQVSWPMPNWPAPLDFVVATEVFQDIVRHTWPRGARVSPLLPPIWERHSLLSFVTAMTVVVRSHTVRFHAEDSNEFVGDRRELDSPLSELLETFMMLLRQTTHVSAPDFGAWIPAWQECVDVLGEPRIRTPAVIQRYVDWARTCVALFPDPRFGFATETIKGWTEAFSPF